ncbi:hypothetical protein LV164_007459 [Aspergillus fumigatus]|nr:hypothetical protein KXX42_007501 [Aspergillus fumigatus]KAH1552829.1 hypothetical protein KXX57_007356 [Aspergillus fumigatus]KAH1983070.1 hypothetical protein KXW88_003779 [Aspergillus fumigatus]KAH2314050.1 hypothetical protein KXV47_002887 [Aspergillus fumigatus]KAH2665054.1 hypothetical protein KXV32_007567 [Aspergillus fumigatus]
MSSQGFSFPPPPPPPPQQQQPPQSTIPSGPPQYGYGSYGQRGGRGAGGHNRGRGRGFGNRGGRGGSFVTHHANHTPTYSSTPSSFGYGSINYTGFTPQSQPTGSCNNPSPHIASLGSPSFQHQSNTSSYASPQRFSQPPVVLGSPYQPQPSYDTAYAPSNAQSSLPYPPVMHSTQHTPQPVQAPMMSPPMRWGFEASPPTGTFASPRRSNQWTPRQSSTHQNQSSSNGNSMKHGGKRDHASAFGGKPPTVAPSVPAPPPVPSFGNPLPVKPPPAVDAANPRKKKRKHNQLGLTPKTEDHESSEEDDVDEESRLAPAAASAIVPLRFTYKGRTSTLQSPTDIAAWIEERKKRFPTQAKAEEKRKAMQEAKKAREEALNKKRIERQEQRRAQKAANDRPESVIDPTDAAAKAKRKADKLQRKLLKEQERVAKAEADAERARLEVERLQKVAMEARRGSESATQKTEIQPSVAAEKPDPESGQKVEMVGSKDNNSEAVAVPTESSIASMAHGTVVTKIEPGDSVESRNEESAASSFDDSDSSDWTSSSGSDISSDSDESDDDSAPEEVSSRREGPERVAPPPRVNKKKVCRHFARNRRCLHGEKCHFLHELPERGPKTKSVEKKGRRGLFQALLERQKEDEDRRAMEVIVWLGENGFLEAPEAEERASGHSHSDGNKDESRDSQETKDTVAAV